MKSHKSPLSDNVMFEKKVEGIMTFLFKEVLSYLKFERKGRGPANFGCVLMHDLQSSCAFRPRAYKNDAESGFIDLFSMSETHNKNDEDMIFKPANETIVPDSIAP